MRLRCIVFILPAAFVTGLIFLLTSSMVSALEGSLTSAFEPSPRPFSVVLVELEGGCGFAGHRGIQVARDFGFCGGPLPLNAAEPLPGGATEDGLMQARGENIYLF